MAKFTVFYEYELTGKGREAEQNTMDYALKYHLLIPPHDNGEASLFAKSKEVAEEIINYQLSQNVDLGYVYRYKIKKTKYIGD